VNPLLSPLNIKKETPALGMGEKATPARAVFRRRNGTYFGFTVNPVWAPTGAFVTIRVGDFLDNCGECDCLLHQVCRDAVVFTKYAEHQNHK
jgi:hypothetical protein